MDKSIEHGLDGSWQITFFETSDPTSKHIKSSRRFDAVIVSTPVPQAKRLLGAWENDIDPNRQLDHDYHSVWTTLLSFPRPTAKLLSFDGCFVSEVSTSSLLSWVASSTKKPNRPNGDYESWILHGIEGWSLVNLENKKEDIAKRMLLDFKRTFSIDIEPSFLTAHRWLYARPKQLMRDRFLYHKELSLGVCSVLLGDSDSFKPVCCCLCMIEIQNHVEGYQFNLSSFQSTKDPERTRQKRLIRNMKSFVKNLMPQLNLLSIYVT